MRRYLLCICIALAAPLPSFIYHNEGNAIRDADYLYVNRYNPHREHPVRPLALPVV